MTRPVEYLIEGRWFTVPGDPVIPAVSRFRQNDEVRRTIVQIVKPPHGLRHETTLALREAWEHNEYFPTVWLARPDIYKDPHILIVSSCLTTVKAKPVLQQQNIAAARFVAVVDCGQDRPEILAFASKCHIPLHMKILGVFERCESQ